MMDEQQIKLTTVLKNILNQSLALNNKQKTTIINYVKEEGNIGNTQICINCMKVALQLWEHEGPTKEPLVFLMDILIEFSKIRNNFVLLHQNNILQGIIHIFCTTDYTKDCDIFQRYIKLLDAFTHHQCGKNWLVGFWDRWKTVFKVIGTQKYTEDLSILLSDLFLSVVDSSEFFSLELSRLVFQPLTIVCIKISQNNLIGILEDDLYYDIIPTLNLISSVIMCISEKATLNNKWLQHCNNLLEFQKPLTLLLEIIEGKELTLELSKLLSGLNFLAIAQNSNNSPKFIKFFFDNTIKLIDVNTTRQFVDNIVILSYHLQHYWHNISRLFDVTKLELPCNFDEFMCIYQVLPLMATGKKVLGKEYLSNMKQDVLRVDHIEDLIRRLGKPILLKMPQLRKFIFVKDSFVVESHLALDYLSRSLCLHNKDCKIIIFNALIYFMGDIVSDIHKNKSIRSQWYDSDVVTHFIDTFTFYVGKCDITWKDVTTHMLAVVTATDLLQIKDLSSEVVVASLKMLDLAITKRMAPDLTLLVDCNSLNSIGSLLKDKLNCEDEEVKCAASKVLVTVSESAKSNYPFFQKILLDSDLPQRLLTRIFNKEVVEVKTNAVKCLQHLVPISSIWDVLSSFLNILDSLINLLKTETDILMKAELVNLMAVIYEEDYFNDLQVNELYNTMTYLGMQEYDLTLRINCLKFWNVVIKKLLIEEGMIDGVFPEVTFSKKSRKIVVLDEEEITRRLKQLMRKLSEIGCLKVLNFCLSTNEEIEKEFVDEIVYNLLVILRIYRIDENNVEMLKSNQNLKNLSAKEFLENVTHATTNGYRDVNDRGLKKILDEILKHNNLADL